MPVLIPPPRGFPEEEFRARVSRAQALMSKAGLAALLLTTEADVRYFSGFLTRFWESPTRPWFLIVPQAGNPIAVIPEIGAALMARTWIADIRTWPAPDLFDDGVSLLASTLRESLGGDGNIGLPMGHESHLRMPLADYARLGLALPDARLRDDGGIMRALRIAKSAREIEKIRFACDIAGRAFARVPEIAHRGLPLAEVFRRFQILCLEEGADWIPYLAGAADQGGYSDVISPAGETSLADGDVLMLDTGLVWDGYFCDFDRNFFFGRPSQDTADAHSRLIEAVHAAAAIARPGALAAELYAAMKPVLSAGRHGLLSGRFGHGFGSQLTEWPSLIPQDQTELVAGMALTLEPAIRCTSRRMLVHEENMVVSEDGVEFLSPLASDDVVIL